MLAGLLGLSVADAIGVPVEFSSRAERSAAPVTSMQGYGTWNQPPGTWSDDSSLTFCLADVLCHGFSLAAIAEAFCRWYTQAAWTPHGEVFDVGNATQAAITRLLAGVPPLEAGGTSDRSNGNGSLMRILPMAFFHKQWGFAAVLDRTQQVSCLTHAHPRSQIACGIYISIAIELLNGATLEAAYQTGRQQVEARYRQEPFAAEWHQYQRIWDGSVVTAPIDSIRSGGYVVDTIEAALWCLFNTDSYRSAVLQAVNLGDDTDTTAAVTGGLAGLHYGLDQLPADWVAQLARKDDIVDLAARLEQAIAAASA